MVHRLPEMHDCEKIENLRKSTLNKGANGMKGFVGKIFGDWNEWNIREAKLPYEKRKKCGFCFYFCNDSNLMGVLSLVVGGESGVCLLQKTRSHYQTPSCHKFRIRTFDDLINSEYDELINEFKKEGFVKTFEQKELEKVRATVKEKGVDPSNTLTVRYRVPDRGGSMAPPSGINTPKFPGMTTTEFYSFFLVEPAIKNKIKTMSINWKIKFFQDTLEDVKKKKNHTKEAIMLCNLALAYYQNRNFEQALKLCQESLEASRKLEKKDLTTKIHAMNTMAGVYRDTGNLVEASPILQESLKLIRDWLKIKENSFIRVIEGSILHNLGVIFREKWNSIDRKEEEAIKALELATKYSLEGLEAFKKAKDPFMIACETEIIAISYHFQNRLEDALQYYQDAVSAWRILGNVKAVAFNSESINTIKDYMRVFSSKKASVKKKPKEEAMQEKESQKKFKTKPRSEKSKKVGISKKSWVEQTLVLKASGNYQKAIGCCEKELKKNQANNQAWGLLGEIYVEIGEYLKADECFKKIKSD